MTVLHTGSTKKFATGWDSIFDKSAARKSATNKSAKKAPAKKASPAAGKPAAKMATKVKKKDAGADKKSAARKKAKRG